MNTLRRNSIVVGVDESALAGQAVRWAAEQAALEGRSLRLVRAVRPVPAGRSDHASGRPARDVHVAAPAQRGAAHAGARAGASGGAGRRDRGAARGHQPAGAAAGRRGDRAPGGARLPRAWPGPEPPAGIGRPQRRPPCRVPGGGAPAGPPRTGSRRRGRRCRRDRGLGRSAGVRVPPGQPAPTADPRPALRPRPTAGAARRAERPAASPMSASGTPWP